MTRSQQIKAATAAMARFPMAKKVDKDNRIVIERPVYPSQRVGSCIQFGVSMRKRFRHV